MKDKISSEPDSASTIGGWMLALVWVIGLVGGSFLSREWLDKRDALRDGVTTHSESGEAALVVRADPYGQYRIAGSANSKPLSFLVDTGASGISIPQKAADRLGLQRGRPLQAITANGVATVYSTTLDSVSIGPFTRHDVKASINPSMEGEFALLGMSFLRHYVLIQREGDLTIERP